MDQKKYLLLEKDNKEAQDNGCNSGCVYWKMGDENPNNRWCFKKGILQSECLVPDDLTSSPELRVNSKNLSPSQNQALSQALGKIQYSSLFRHILAIDLGY